MTNPQQAPSADDLLFGGGARSYSFKAIGDSITGTLTGKDAVHKTDFITKEKQHYADGNPIYQLVLTLKTDLRDPEIEDDDGSRRVYCSPALKSEVAKAISVAGGKGLALGSKFHITFVREVPAKGNPKKEYTVQVTMPADLAVQAPVAAPVVQVAAPVAAQPVMAPGVTGITPELQALMTQLAAQQAK